MQIKELINTALYEMHVNLGAKMVPFAGFVMPVQYEGINSEHLTVRNSVGVFDVSHMGEFFITGANALALIQSVTSNNAANLVDGKIQYSCLPNEQGGIVDDLLVYRFSEEKYMLVVNASNIAKDWNWIKSRNNVGADMSNRSDDYSLLAVQGPSAIDALQSLTDVKLKDIVYYNFTVGKFAGFDDVIISATGYTGAGGGEIYCKNNQVKEIWNAIFKSGESFGIKPVGLGARDTLRLEMGFCLYGNDINDTTSPIEAGLGWITSFKKDFTNSVALKAQKDNGISKKLVGFEMIDKGIPRHGYAIIEESGNEIGEVTSGTMSPSLKVGIGMGYVPTGLSAVGSIINIAVRNKSLKAKVVKLPFYKG